MNPGTVPPELTINMMSLWKVTSVIIIADLLLTWQHLTTMNIAIAK